MTYDDGFDPGFDLDDDPVDFFAVPVDHPAFRQQEDDGEGTDSIGESNGYGGENDEIGSPILNLPVGRYDGFSNQDNGEVVGLAREDVARQRAADQQFLRERLAASKRDDATRAIGQRNAIAHSRDVADGKGGSGEDREPSLHDALAASLEDAGIAFRDEWGGISGVDNPAVVDPESIGRRGPKKDTDGGPIPLYRSSRKLAEAPAFRECTMTGQLGGIKSNAAGEWIVTLRIDAESYEEATKLGKAHGLALDIAITRKSRDSE